MRGPACRPGRRRGAPSLCSQSTVEGRQPPPICCCVSVSRCKVAVASPFFTPAAAPQGGCRAARFCGGTFCPGPDFTPVRLCGLPELFRTGRFSPVPPRRFRLAAFVPPRPIVTARLCGLQGFWEWTRFPTARAMPGTSFSRRRFLAPARLCGLTGFLGQAVFANPAHALAFCPSAVAITPPGTAIHVFPGGSVRRASRRYRLYHRVTAQRGAASQKSLSSAG